MFEEAQLFSPVTGAPGGDVRVELADDHPGVADPAYRARRNAIAALALSYHRGDPIPHADYTEAEHEVWRVVSRELAMKHERYACRAFLDAKGTLDLPADRIPQLDEVSARLSTLTDFRYEPVAGLATLRHFYGSLGDGYFLSTQYIRHHSVPLYTPEPDVVHEVLGHANTLASPELSALYRAAGRAAQRVGDAALEVLSRVFWFALEFGVVHEDGELKAYGAGILSSYGEIEEYNAADIRPLDVAAMANQGYDITHYQPVLFGGASMGEVQDVIGGFFDGFDDEVGARVLAAAAPA
jgi:phenylalanine-4-hydroxylase